MAAATRRAHDYRLPGGAASGRPLGERIKQFVIDKVDSGAWPEGFRVPSESALAAAFGTARMTVHSALRELGAEGVLVRRPGAGTRVAARRPQAALLEVRNIHDEIVERGHRHAARVQQVGAEACDLATATELGIAPGTVVFHSVIVHLENERPLQLEDRHVLPAFAPQYDVQDFTRRTPNDYLMSLGPLDEVEHVIQALNPDRATRALLELGSAEPVLQVRRRTWSRGVVVSTARLLHPGSRFSLVGRFRVGRRGAR